MNEIRLFFENTDYAKVLSDIEESIAICQDDSDRRTCRIHVGEGAGPAVVRFAQLVMEKNIQQALSALQKNLEVQLGVVQKGDPTLYAQVPFALAEELDKILRERIKELAFHAGECSERHIPGCSCREYRRTESLQEKLRYCVDIARKQYGV